MKRIMTKQSRIIPFSHSYNLAVIAKVKKAVTKSVELLNLSQKMDFSTNQYDKWSHEV